MKKKNPLIKSKERVQKHAEVYTPQWLVKDMCDMLSKEGDAFQQLGEIFLEPACGNGNFLEEILRRKLELCNTPNDIFIALNSIYGIDILDDNVKESRLRMCKIATEKYASMIDNHVVDVSILSSIYKIVERNIFWGDSLKIIKFLENHNWDDLPTYNWDGVVAKKDSQ